MRRILLILCLALCCGTAVFLPRVCAGEAPAERVVLNNGMTVVVRRMPASPVVALSLAVRAGSATEGKYLGSGMSHFVEHMLFKGTHDRGVGRIAKEVRALGGVINASTGFDRTIYTLELPAGRFREGLSILADMILNPSFDPEEFEKERGVILNEMRMYRDNPEREMNRLLFANAYVRHPYRHPVIGYRPLFEAITRENLISYYQSRYIPNNMVLSVAGNVDVADAFAGIHEAFDEFAARPYVPRLLAPEPPQLGMRHIEQEYPTDLTRMMLAYRGVDAFDPDMFALDVLAMILGHGKSSRLYRDLIDAQGLVDSISAGNFTPSDKGFFAVECIVRQDTKATLAAIRAQIQGVKDNGIDEAELKKAQQQVVAQHIRGLEQASGVSYDMAFHEAIVYDYDFSRKYVEGINTVTQDDVARVARRYLTDTALTVVVVKPESSSDAAPEPEDMAVIPEIKKTVLPNGLTLLVREEHRLPLVSAVLAANGGLLYETEKTNGLSHLLSQLWTKGTATRTADDIARTVEARGIQLNGFSGRNSLGLTADILSDDLAFYLELLSDLVHNPLFPDGQLVTAKAKTKSQILADNDSIFTTTQKALKERLFSGHPYRFEVIGALDSIEQIARKDIIALYQQLATPENMVLAIYGDVHYDDVVAMVGKLFADIPQHPVQRILHDVTSISTQQETLLRLDKEQAMVIVGFHAPAIDHDDRYGVEVLSAVLGSSMSGRIFTRVREKYGEAYTLGGGYVPGIGTGFMYFYVATSNEHTDAVRDMLFDEFHLIARDTVSDAELADTKAYLKGTHAMQLETNNGIALASTLDELYGLGFDDHIGYDQRIDRVTKKQVRELAQRYLNADKAVVVVSEAAALAPARP